MKAAKWKVSNDIPVAAYNIINYEVVIKFNFSVYRNSKSNNPAEKKMKSLA